MRNRIFIREEGYQERDRTKLSARKIRPLAYELPLDTHRSLKCTTFHFELEREIYAYVSSALSFLPSPLNAAH